MASEGTRRVLMVPEFRDRGMMRLLCKHTRLRCVHGDEIIARGFARAACLDCGRSRRREPLPAVCSVTGRLHASHVE